MSMQALTDPRLRSVLAEATVCAEATCTEPPTGLVRITSPRGDEMALAMCLVHGYILGTLLDASPLATVAPSLS